MNDNRAVRPDEPSEHEAPLPEDRARWLADPARKVRSLRRPFVWWSLAALIVPFPLTLAQMFLALVLEALAPTSDEVAAVLGGTSPLLGALFGALCTSRLPLSFVVRCVLGLAYFTVAFIAMTFFMIACLPLLPRL